jgi:hypothetical protein
MKTAREIIASLYPGSKLAEVEAAADAILAALAAEGFSIVETGRDPVTIEVCARLAEGMEPEPFIVKGGQSGDEISFGEPNKHRIAASIRSLSRSTREGKT